MKIRLCISMAVAALLATVNAQIHAQDSASWRFVSMPDFLNVDTDYPQKGWEDSLGYILKSVKAEQPEFVVVPGDLVMGHWHGEAKRPGIPGIEHFASRYYPAWKARLAAHGLQW